jgi:hypothetical protein
LLRAIKLPDPPKQFPGDRGHGALDRLQPSIECGDDVQPPQAPGRDLQAGEDLVQVPAQAGLHAGPLSHQILAVVHQQPQPAGLAVKPPNR